MLSIVIFTCQMDLNAEATLLVLGWLKLVLRPVVATAAEVHEIDGWREAGSEPPIRSSARSAASTPAAEAVATEPRATAAAAAAAMSSEEEEHIELMPSREVSLSRHVGNAWKFS